MIQATTQEYRSTHEQMIVADFFRFLTIPNIAGDETNIARNATLIKQMLEARGIATRFLAVDGSPPVVFGELEVPTATLTVLVYAHYDGQPVQIENWASDPWTPVVRDAPVERGGRLIDLHEAEPPFDPQWRIFARSAADDKAPIIALLAALDALRAQQRLPSVNLKFFFEGEEEAGSPHLRETIAAHRDLLEADLWLFCDGPIHQTGRQQLSYGVRGITGFDLTVYGAIRPLHSGHYGNWAPNPISMLVRLLTSMRDEEGLPTIRELNELVAPPTPGELAAIEDAPRVDNALKRELGLVATEGNGERIELTIMKPSVNFRGIRAGNVKDQARNVIVSEATASVGLRLVPGLTPENVRAPIEAHIEQHGFHLVDESPDMNTRLKHDRIAQIVWDDDGYPAFRTAMDAPLAAALSDILNVLTEGMLVRMPTMGGSLPLYIIEEELGVPIIVLPIANHDNNQHGENENLKLENLWNAIDIYAAIFATLGRYVNDQ